MKVNIHGININIKLLADPPSSVHTVFCLHGFTGSLMDWEEIAFYMDSNFCVYGIDLPGHGESDSPSDPEYYSQSFTVKIIKFAMELFGSGKHFVMGYSMGGRAALSYACDSPIYLDGLILESSTPGIINDEERAARKRNDNALAEYILEIPIEEFVDHWMNLDIFNTQKRFSDEKLKEIREMKIMNNKTGLANSLRGFGTGAMNPLHEKLQHLDIPVLLITGGLDRKFTDINAEMVKHFKKASHVSISNAGHNVHLEAPQQFIRTINEFLSKQVTVPRNKLT